MAFATDTYVIKGMRQDDSDLLFNGNKEGLSFAFENLNMRFTTDTETTSLVATQENGNTKCVVKVYPQFFTNIENVAGSFYNITTLPFRILGHCEIDKYLVLFGKCTTDTTVTNADGQTLTFATGNDVIVRLERQNDEFYGWLIYNSTELNFDLNWPLETLGNIETNLIKKVYFVDGINVPRVVNVVNPDAGQLSNINLGFDLQLKDVFTVKKESSVAGKYPMGKVRFFYTYFNDNFSETNIVDWSPFFDCNYINQGGGPDSQYTTQFAFRAHIDNVDTQFKFVRIYFQHFTNNDATTYQLKYIERPITSDTIDVVITYDEEDAKDSNDTYLDKKLTSYTFIPYTLAEKNNRLFYGNIKKSIPSIKDITFDPWPDVAFKHKQIGYMNDSEDGEHFISDNVYQYEPDRLTFRGSNFDYMGFRKYNWYRFGIIAQYKTGEWSDVIFICDKQCDIASKTEIEYNEINTSSLTPGVTPISGTSGTFNRPNNRPLRSIYYIPEAYITPNVNFANNIAKLKAAGFKRFKPVCVVPPKGYRNVITQGLSCATMYRGGDRNKSALEINSRGLFAIPSYFFRPLPLYPDEVLKVSNSIIKPNYSFTIRKVSDLTLASNIKVGDKWILNPPFDNDLYTNYNSAYREFRHGFSLPPKDTINAELQSSDISICDYFYNVNNRISSLFNPSITSNTNLMQLAWDGRDNVLNVVNTNPYGHSYSNVDEYLWRYQVVPQHPLMLTGYNNTMFIDESILTLNSPEIDYDYSSSISAYYKDRLIEVAGYAQVTSSQVNYDISQTKFDQSDASDGEQDIDKTSFYNISGDCLFNLVHSDYINAPTKTMLFNQQRRVLKGGSMLPVCGPWWFDTMLVAAMRPLFDNWPDNYASPSLAIGPPNPIDGQDKVFVNTDNIDLNFHNSTPLVRFKHGTINPPNIKYTTSFYGEVNNTLVKTTNNSSEDEGDGTIKRQILYTSSSIYPVKKLIGPCTSAVFNDFAEAYTTINNNMDPNGAHHIPEYIQNVYKASGLGLTFNTKLLDYLDIAKSNIITDDVYWIKYDEHRQYKPGTTSYITLSSDPANNFQHNDDNFFTIYCLKKQGNNYQIEDHNNSIPQSWIRNASGFDMLGTTSYYFFPYDINVITPQINNYSRWLNDTTGAPYYVTHPMILPQMTHGWHSTNSTIYALLNNDSTIDYFALNEYGCHYYAPFSTNFLSMLFDPYYAHVVYPFMNTSSDNGETPFCGSSDVYREGNIDKRPKQNATHSSLYSCCTNYIYNTDLTTFVHNLNTVSAYHCSPAITQVAAPEPMLSLPYLRNTTLSRVYSFKYDTSAGVANVPTITHKTLTLTAATKWYRGFKTLKTPDLETDELVNNGNYITKSSIQGNLFFSGWMPQFISKSGLLRYNTNPASLTELGLQINSNCYLYSSDSFANPNDFAIFDNVSDMYIELDYNVAPHIVYYTYQSDNELRLLSDFYMYDSNAYNLYTNSYQFKPQYYYKTFRANQVPKIAKGNTNILKALAHLNGIAGWYRSTYPHTGWFEPLRLTPLSYNSKPYWNNTNTLPNYPQTITQNHIEITQDMKRHGLLHHDINGKEIAKQDMFVLPISNMYDNKLITDYSTANPYTYENISCEHWNWKMCGPTYNFDSFEDTTSRWPSIDYKEGDTYFQRYNCMKTFAKEVEETGDKCYNNVSETASVMIETYLNIDGLYWEYPSTTGFLESNLINPTFNNQSQINRVYSIQNDICDTFKQIDPMYYNSELTHYPTEILWSAQKQDGETTDSWGIIPATNKMLVSGEMGSINKLLSFNDKVFCFQDHGLSVLNYNPQVISPTNTDSTLSIYLSDATKLQDVTYISRNIGTLNKWSVALSQQGFYWIDDTLKQICGYLKKNEARYGLVDMSSNYGFKSWSNAHISSDNCVWNINVFPSGNNAFKANYDLKNHDVYWANGEYCICYNELLDCFTSFYSYEKTPYKFNYLDECYSICNQTTLTESDTLWHDYSNYTHSLYGHSINSYIELLVNPSGQYDKIFNFIEYAAEKYDPQLQFDVAFPKDNPYNHIRVNNTYQIGLSDLDKFNTQNRFKLWRTTLPREFKDGKQTMNRIRSPWCKIKLEKINTMTEKTRYRDKLYYINVNYTIPEQPLKTNIRS